MTSTEHITITATTESGVVRGETREGIHSFKGIPYGAPTSGANRFLPPRKPASWTGTRDATEYGPIAPQLTRDGGAGTPIDDARGSESEACLVLNVFTPGTDGAKRPVMFWCHGGGFISGSAARATTGRTSHAAATSWS